MRPRALVVGVGNVLRGDDGFGVEVAHRLADVPEVTARAKVIESGTGGVHLVQELLDGYDQLVIVDATDRGGPPGRLYVLEVEVPDAPATSFGAWQDELTDLHEAVPSKVLVVAKALGVLPKRVLLVGCQPLSTDEVAVGLSGPVSQAVGDAVDRIRALLDPVEDLRWRDELLQVMYWLRGEGLREDVTADELRRFLEADPDLLDERLTRLVTEGYAETVPRDPARDPAQYRLSPLGVTEGGRRFHEEFAPFLGRESHNQCGDPDCECQTSGEACTRLGERSG
jgi:hydrogenase maturation protease